MTDVDNDHQLLKAPERENVILNRGRCVAKDANSKMATEVESDRRHVEVLFDRTEVSG